MSDTGTASKGNKFLRMRKILRLLLFISIPFGCCGGIYLLDALPKSMLPPAMDFSLNLFESNTFVENKTEETLYITPITTTYGEPRLIPQFGSIRQRDIPLPANQSATLAYDSADMPLSGIAVCNVKNECRLLPVENSNRYKITSFENLSELDASWLSAIQSHPKYSFGSVFMVLFVPVPILLFSVWIYLKKLEMKQSA